MTAPSFRGRSCTRLPGSRAGPPSGSPVRIQAAQSRSTDFGRPPSSVRARKLILAARSAFRLGFFSIHVRRRESANGSRVVSSGAVHEFVITERAPAIRSATCRLATPWPARLGFPGIGRLPTGSSGGSRIR